jgi:hypothetical protein
MALIDHLIEIIAGKNDLPSTVSDSFHPDGSYVTSKYNALINELRTIIPNEVVSTSQIWYVDSATGSDSNDGATSGTAFLTIDRACQEIRNKRWAVGAIPEIRLAGTFTDEIFDLSGANIDESTMYITSTDNLNRATLNYTNSTSSASFVNHSLLSSFYIFQIDFDLNNHWFQLYTFGDVNLEELNVTISGGSFARNMYINFAAYLYVYDCTFTDTSGNTSNWGLFIYNVQAGDVDQCTFTDVGRCIDMSNSVINNTTGPHTFTNPGTYEISVRSMTRFNTDQHPASQAIGWTYASGATVIADNRVIGAIKGIEALAGDTLTLKQNGSNPITLDGQAVDIVGGNELRINGTKILGTQEAAISDATGGTEITTINAILTALRNHGLIAP